MQVESYSYGHIAFAVNIGIKLDLTIFLDVDHEIETALFICCRCQRVVVHFLFSLIISRIFKGTNYFPIKAILTQIRLADPHLIYTPAISICTPLVEKNIAGEF